MNDMLSSSEPASDLAAAHGVALARTHADPPGLRPVPRLTSRDLLEGSRELEILHGDAVYRLRLTAMGKLILTK